ncbi:hypothetical protein QUF64_01550 [Anaerolineales bacterium HSG6]|nr:hypothetical protein [Anaerolineales bacterium HSG6]
MIFTNCGDGHGFSQHLPELPTGERGASHLGGERLHVLQGAKLLEGLVSLAETKTNATIVMNRRG